MAGGGVWTCDKGYGHLAGEVLVVVVLVVVVLGGDMWQGWGHVAGGGGMWQGWILENMTNVKKSKMLTMDEIHKEINLNFNLKLT